jgi:hypothetical protein
VVDWEKFQKMSLSMKCGACYQYSGAEHHWTDTIQAELLRGFCNGRSGGIISEMEAIRELVERHRQEFDSLLAAVRSEVTLQESDGTRIGRWVFVGFTH